MKIKYFILTLVPVLLLSGCKWFGSSKQESAAGAADVTMAEGVLATWGDGSAAVTEAELNELYEQVKKNDSRLANLDDSVAGMVKQQIFGGLLQQKIMSKYVKENKIDQSPEYKAKREQALKNIEKNIDYALAAEYFLKSDDSAVTEQEVKDAYEKLKDQFFANVMGGVKAAGVRFEKEADAQAFLSKVGSKVAEFEKQAKADAKIAKNFQDFKYVNVKSVNMDPELKGKILTIAKTPSVTVVKINDNAFWVVAATDKKASQYMKYEDVKGQCEEFVKQQKGQETGQKRFAEMKEKFGLNVKEDAFLPKQQELPVEPAAQEKQELSNEPAKEAAEKVEDVAKAAKAA